jgi:hypothetical protein
MMVGGGASDERVRRHQPENGVSSPMIASSARAWVRAVVAVACGVIPAAAAPAAEAFTMRVNAAGVRLGSLVSGTTLPKSGLAHRVVAIEYWALGCPVCGESLPKLNELHTKHHPAGLVVIGAVPQGSEPAKVKDAVTEAGVTFPIVNGAEVAGGMDFKTTPHLMVFDHAGRCIFRGAPDDGYEVITAAVRASPGSILEGRTLTKLAALQSSLVGGPGVAVTLRKARAQVASADEATAEEAKYVVERIEAFGRRLLDDAAAAKASDPVRTAALVQQCATDFKGTPLGTEAAAMGRDLKRNASFQAALAATQEFAQLQALRTQVLASFRSTGTATPEMVARVPPAVKQQMAELVGRVQKHLPGSKFATEAGDIALEFSLQPNAGQPAP